ncbi:hypothetical protein EVB87_173 [Rhizobium phage RHph_N28_1]|nr:hypothetical protein EVB87_173 [Rhizobium phage RHph_N28_1]QIG74202.1 hypothetical protein EVC07_174 [Rhizobium phage RHph_N42]QIG74809.1 hypothetical protein EVC12_174 [Rhizobium phage RHph_I42]QXV73861.1 hypothetical protein [Rhizobium phage RHph_N46]
MRQMKPIIHHNGTTREELVAMRLSVLEKLRDAYEEMRKLAPHGRDYPNADFTTDRDLHWARCADLHNLIEEVQAEAEAIADGAI